MSKTIGLAWFLRDDYEQIKAICEDQMHDTYDEWETAINARMKPYEAVGLVLEKVIVRPAELHAWAQSQGLPINAGARATYAAMLLARQSHPGMN